MPADLWNERNNKFAFNWQEKKLEILLEEMDFLYSKCANV
jgi:hypothetical protein